MYKFHLVPMILFCKWKVVTLAGNLVKGEVISIAGEAFQLRETKYAGLKFGGRTDHKLLYSATDLILDNYEDSARRSTAWLYAITS
jgi:hypothetical protein